MSSPHERQLRIALVETCRALADSGLTHGTSGNVSVRCADGFLVSPTGVDYRSLAAEDLPWVSFAGTWYGALVPSSEWRFHRDLLAARPEHDAVVHTHSAHATALACRGEGIPAFHYMVAVAGGKDIRCAPYATFGTQELSDAAVAALDGRRACLLANHGVIALGQDLTAALELAGEVENLARQYLLAQLGGSPRLLGDDELDRVLEKFATYGQAPTSDTADDGALRFGGRHRS